MRGYTALTTGLFGPLAVNRKLIAVWAELKELKAEVAKLKGEVAEDEQEIVEETAAPEESTEDKEPAFDWRTSEDVVELKEFALLELGLTIKGNKKPETVRSEIEGFLEVNGN